MTLPTSGPRVVIARPADAPTAARTFGVFAQVSDGEQVAAHQDCSLSRGTSCLISRRGRAE